MILTREEVFAACDEAHDARGYTEAMALAEVLERKLLEKIGAPNAKVAADVSAIEKPAGVGPDEC